MNRIYIIQEKYYRVFAVKISDTTVVIVSEFKNVDTLKWEAAPSKFINLLESRAIASLFNECST